MLKNLPVVLLLIATMLLAGCAPAPTPEPTPVPPTATPIPPTSTPEPTATNTATPLPTATATPDAKATQSALATSQAAESIAVIGSILQEYGLDTSEGQLGEMIPEPLAMTADSYGATIYNSLSQDTYADFILYTEISWKSTSGLAGCALVFRAEDDDLNKDYYQFNTLRLSGAPAWDVEFFADGKFKSNAVGKVKFSNDINVGNGDTNTYLLVMKEKLLTIYVNGKKLSAVDITQRTEPGPIIALTIQESGETTCTFSNSWVWRYK